MPLLIFSETSLTDKQNFFMLKVTKPLYFTSLVFSVCFLLHYYILIIFCIIYVLKLKHWVILENNHTYTMHSTLEFQGNGVLWTGNLKVWLLTIGFPTAWGQARVWKHWQQCRWLQKAGQKTSINYWSSICSGSVTEEN